MSNTFKTSFNKFKQEHLKDLFIALEQVLKEHKVDFYFVGAFAKEIWNAVHHLSSNRITNDIDIAVLIPDASQFEYFRKKLLTNKHFEAIPGNEIKFLFDNAILVDVIPFGGFDIFSEDSFSNVTAYIAVPDNGFKEVYEVATNLVQFDEDWVYKVCSLPGIVLLKLLAYDDLPEYRVKDLQDIYHIIRHYYYIVDDLIYEEHLELFEDISDTTTIGARVLGRQMGNVLQANTKLREKITNILAKEVAEQENGAMAIRMVWGTDEEARVIASWISAMFEGIND